MNKAPEALEYLKPEPHPLRPFFRQHGVTYAMIARHCGCSVGWVGQLMAGYRPMPRRMAARLHDLAERLEPGAGRMLLEEAGGQQAADPSW